MPYSRSVGEIPAKRHTQFRQPDGTLYAEELMGEEGLSGAVTLTDTEGLKRRLNQLYEKKANEYAALNGGNLDLGKKLAQQDLSGYLKYLE